MTIAKPVVNSKRYNSFLFTPIGVDLLCMGMIQKQGNWVRLSWSREVMNGVSLLANSWFKSGIGRGFYIAFYPATKNGSTTIIPSAENRGECPDMPSRRRPDRISTMPRLCSAFGGTSSVWRIMSCWNRLKSSQGIGIERNWCVWAKHWRKNVHSTKRDT